VSVATCSPGEGGADDATEGSGCDDGAAVGLDTSSTGLGARTEGTISRDDTVDGARERVAGSTRRVSRASLASVKDRNSNGP